MDDYAAMLERAAEKLRKSRIDRHAKSAIIISPDDVGLWVAENVLSDEQAEVLERVEQLRAEGFTSRGRRYTEEEREEFMKTRTKGSRTVATKDVREEIRRYVADRLRQTPQIRRAVLLDAVNMKFGVEITPDNFSVSYVPQAKKLLELERHEAVEKRTADVMHGNGRPTVNVPEQDKPEASSVGSAAGGLAQPTTPASEAQTTPDPAPAESQLVTSGPVFVIEAAEDGRVRVIIDFEAPPATGFAAFAALAQILSERGGVEWDDPRSMYISPGGQAYHRECRNTRLAARRPLKVPA